jgi:hypothetical protein
MKKGNFHRVICCFTIILIMSSWQQPCYHAFDDAFKKAEAELASDRTYCHWWGNIFGHMEECKAEAEASFYSSINAAAQEVEGCL